MTDDRDELPAPPWRTQSSRKARAKPPLTREAIVAATLELLDREGVEAVSMRAVAQELGTGPASIYRHVSGKDELLEIVLDRVLSEVRVPEPDPADWRARLRALAYEVRRVLSAHRDIARIAMTSKPVGPHPIRIAEGVLAILRTAGFPDAICAWAMDRLSLYVIADVYERTLFAGQDAEPAAEHWRQVHDYYRSLPPERFPHTVAMLDTLFAGSPDDRFALGLDLLIDGLATRLAGVSRG